MSSTDGDEDDKEKQDKSPLREVNLNLNLYNYDSPAAQNCPYVLTSPRSLEACSRVGIKPVDLLHKTLAEFTDDVPKGKPLDEVFKLYDDYEQKRVIMLEKCQAEREFIIWRSTSKRRSQSLSPCRREKLFGQATLDKPQGSGDENFDSSDSKPTSSKESDQNCPIASQSVTQKSVEDITSPESASSKNTQYNPRQSRSSSVKNISNKGQRPTSWSTPASPFYRGSQTLFVRITSPVVCAKLQSFPRAKLRLPPKDMKILEVILQKYEKQEEEEEHKAAAQRAWDREKEERDRRRESAEQERWRYLASKTRSKSEEITKQQVRSLEEHPKQKQSSGAERLSRYDIEQKGKMLKMKEEKAEKRKQELLLQRDRTVKRSAEELRERMKQVKMNQQELDKAMEKWQQQIAAYQEAANRRAAEKAAENLEQRRRRVKQERMMKEADHKKKMQRLEVEEEAKLQDMIARLKSKDERCKVFAQERLSAIEQSRTLAQAASDLRDLIRQRLDNNSFLKRSQQVVLESRLQQMESRLSLPKRQEHSEEQY